MKIAPILRDLKTGESFQFTKAQYNSILSTCTRLRKSGYGLYQTKIIGDWVSVTRFEKNEPVRRRNSGHRDRARVTDGLDTLNEHLRNYDKSKDKCEAVFIVRKGDRGKRIAMPIVDLPEFYQLLRGFLSVKYKITYLPSDDK